MNDITSVIFLILFIVFIFSTRQRAIAVEKELNIHNDDLLEQIKIMKSLCTRMKKIGENLHEINKQ